MVNKIKVTMPTKEQIEYEDAKRDFRIATAKARLNSAGIDPSKISQQAIDKVMRIFDDMDHIQQDTQQKTSKLQRDAETSIQKVNQDANQKFNDIQKKYQDLINSLKGDKKEDVSQIYSQIDSQIDVQQAVQVEPAKEEVREKTHDEKVAEITEILLHAVKGSVEEKVNELMCIIDQKTNDIVTKDSGKEEQTKQTDENDNKIVDSETNI